MTFVERLRKAGLLATGIEIPSNSAGERIHGTGTLGPDRAQERQTVRREELAGGLDAREEDLLPALHPGLASGRSFQGLERLAERRHRLAQRLDPDRQSLGHFVPPITRRTSDAKSAKRPSTSKNLYGSSTSPTCRCRSDNPRCASVTRRRPIRRSRRSWAATSRRASSSSWSARRRSRRWTCSCQPPAPAPSSTRTSYAARIACRAALQRSSARSRSQRCRTRPRTSASAGVRSGSRAWIHTR